MKQRIGFAVFVIVALGACTRSLPYKSVGKPDIGVTQMSKDMIDTNVDYFYVGATLEGSRFAGSARPHSMGDGQRVRFVFQEKSLQVVEPEEDRRFAKNSTNNRAVLSIPIEHIDYRCAEDAYGKCTNKEEENKDIPWNKRSQFKLKLDELSTQQLSFLPLEFENYFFGCYEAAGSKYIKSDVQKDHINFIIETVFKTKLLCADSISADNTFTLRYQHSFVKLNKITTPGYKALVYTRTDERNFGFFNTEKQKLDIDNNSTESGEKAFFNRWNPGRTVVYYLSEEFKKPENASLKKATYDSFALINDGLKKAGTALRLTLKEPVAEMSPGDVRYNMIVLVEDPLAAGVIGYGPLAANPLTGEILNAKVVMYLGTMKKYLKYSYDDLIKARIAAQSAPPTPVEDNSPKAPEPTSPSVAQVRSRLAVLNRANKVKVSKNKFQLQKLDLKKQVRRLEVQKDSDRTIMKELNAKGEYFSKKCYYPAQESSFDAAVVKGADQLIEKFGLKSWDELSDAQREVVIRTLLPYVWIPTFIHELGHNLGLRHNFSGSTDKDNFYSTAELRQLGVNQPTPYSSMMDYPYSEVNALRVLGKYDIAALRYGYAEKVTLEDGKVISVRELNKNPSLAIKSYGYCTDEHVGVNANCNRFDEGTNFTEIAQHYVRAYNERYKRSNFRNSRLSFSQLDDSGQISALNGTFSKLRMMFERYEALKNDFGLGDSFGLDDPELDEDTRKFLTDIKTSAQIAGEFFLNVMKTPDTTCVVGDVNQPGRIAGVLPIRRLSKRAISCFDQENVQLNPQFQILWEAGRSFQSRKDPSSNNPYADQIDVRGIYIDKMLAAYYLTAREIGISAFDDYTENFLDMPEMQRPVLETLHGLLMDKLTGPVPLRDRSGKTGTFNLQGYSLFSETDADNSHKLSPIMDDRARSILQLPDTTTNFQTQLVRTLYRNIPSQPHHAVAAEILNLFNVRRDIPRDGRDNEYLVLAVGGERYFVHTSSAFAMDLGRSLQISTALSALTPDQLKRIQESIAQDAANATTLSHAGTAEAPAIAASRIQLNAQETRAKALGATVIKDFVNGEYREPTYYGTMIQMLGRM